MSKNKADKPVIKTGVVVEGVDMRTYRSTENPRHVAGVTYRSVNEAFKDWEYACAVEKHKSDFRHALEWFSELFMTFFWIGAGLSLPILFVLWLFK
jgi:hypothetical protein